MIGPACGANGFIDVRSNRQSAFAVAAVLAAGAACVAADRNCRCSRRRYRCLIAVGAGGINVPLADMVVRDAEGSPP
jgi:hypothetical protein